MFQARRLEVRLRGEPAFALRVGSCGGSGRAAARLDSEHFETFERNQGLSAFFTVISCRIVPPVIGGLCAFSASGACSQRRIVLSHV
jgi:hypothetical protein